MAEDRVEAVLQTLTLAQKASLCSGASSWTTRALPERGVPSVFMADGPTGLRKEDPEHAAENGGPSVKATCFPTEATLANSWDPALAASVGCAIGAECRAHEVAMLLAPGVNMKRSPLCGRNFEYYAEDPLLAGKLAASFIRGLQVQGVGCSLKHFAANNQETLRLTISSEVDERALREIYLRAFEIAVREAHPASVMCSYNRINGVHSADNKELLTDILRGEWGFDGIVVSDWGAVNDRVQGIRAGLDLEMPGSGNVNDAAILEAVKSGALSEKELNAVVRRLLRFVFARSEALTAPPQAHWDASQNHALAVRAAAESAVLLKNDAVLPLSREEKVLFVGEMARTPRCQGGGSSIVNAVQKQSALTAARRQGYEVLFAPGWSEKDTDAADDALVHEAVNAAAACDKIVLFLGLSDRYECEGEDRTQLQLPPAQVVLLHALHRCGKPLAVVLSGGSPVELPWLAEADALLTLYLGGEGVGEAACRLLWGTDAPCGKLAETWPLQLMDTPAARHFPMGPRYVSYAESIYIGYRYYDSANKLVQFPFGYGLSYTRFAYADLNVTAAADGCTVCFALTNIGPRAGAEICQCYVHCCHSAVYRAEQELAAFAKIELQPGETQQVTLVLPQRAFQFYLTTEKHFVTEAGEYEIRVGGDSRGLSLRAAVTLPGEQVAAPNGQEAEAFYGHIRDNSFPLEQFDALHPRPALENRPARRGEFDFSTTLDELSVTLLGRLIRGLGCRIGTAAIHFVDSPQLNRRIARRMAGELPVKNLVLMSGGCVSYETAAALLDVCNGRGGWGRLARGCRRTLRQLRHRQK